MSTSTDQLVNTPPAGPSDDRELSEVLASLIAGTQALVKKEIELAKLEVKQIVVQKAIGLGLALGGALLLLFVLAFIGVTAAAALQQVVAPWIAWLIVTGAYTLVAAILLAIAAVFLKKSMTPERTKSSVQETTAWAKRQVQG